MMLIKEFVSSAKRFDSLIKSFDCNF